MKMNRRLTNGLAWAGALLVIGIPAADYISGAFTDTGTPSVAVVDAEPVAAEAATVVPPVAAKPAVVEASAPAATPAAKPLAVASTADPVSAFEQSGKPLPSYITGGDTPAAATPAKPVTPSAQTPVTPVPAAMTPKPVEQVAALPVKVAPTPMPLSMRPQPVSVPLALSPALIIDRPTVAPVVPAQPQTDFVTSEDLEDWESGPLNEFLARRGQQSSATYSVQQNKPAYDGNGFWLDEGPRSQRYRDGDVYYTPF